MLQQGWRCGRLLEDSPLRAQVSGQRDSAAVRRQGSIDRTNHTNIEDLGPSGIVCDRSSVGGDCISMEERQQLGEDGWQPAGVIEVLHLVTAGGPDIGEQRRASRDFVEQCERQPNPYTTGYTNEMDTRVRAAT